MLSNKIQKHWTILLAISSIGLGIGIWLKKLIEKRDVASVGIIGGADGPTAVFVTFNTRDLIGNAIICGLIGLLICFGVVYIKKYRKRDK